MQALRSLSRPYPRIESAAGGGIADVSKQIFMRVKLFCAFRSRHPHPSMHTPLPIDTHLYFYHHPTAPTMRIVYDTIRLIISCLYATIDRTANCTRHSDSKTVAPRALLATLPLQIRVFFFFFNKRAPKTGETGSTGLSVGRGYVFSRDSSSSRTAARNSTS